MSVRFYLFFLIFVVVVVVVVVVVLKIQMLNFVPNTWVARISGAISSLGTTRHT